jgi:hypothetical protein
MKSFNGPVRVWNLIEFLLEGPVWKGSDGQQKGAGFGICNNIYLSYAFFVIYKVLLVGISLWCMCCNVFDMMCGVGVLELSVGIGVIFFNNNGGVGFRWLCL